ncbi:MAG: hypothetical protein ACMVY4_00860 [Minwuia sp.]|uniref:hypothetical protein n=1 Tax=Minwuia sp. TaxID=2493630 RepID=UPI003A8B7BCA
MEFTRFNFDNKIFSIPGAFIFGNGHDREPMLSVQMGDLKAALPIPGVCREFGIEQGTPDHKLLELAAKALNYVKYISPGDQIPNEILNGTASWALEDHHLEYAKNRLLLSLAAWASGQSLKSKDPVKICEMLESPEVKTNLQQGFERAATELKLEGGREAVMALVDQVARERAYVVSLREYYQWILALPNNLKRAQAIFREDRHSLEVAVRVYQLAAITVKDYHKRFDAFDAQLDEPRSVLRNLPATIDFIRDTRDDLHRDTLWWKDIEEEWKDPPFGKPKTMRKNISDIYAFLAQHFMPE